MHDAVNLILVLVMLVNVYLVGTDRLKAAIQIVAVQGALLGFLPALIPGHFSLEAMELALVFIVTKGIAMPVLLSRALRDLSVTRDIEPQLGFSGSMLTLAIGTGAGLAMYSELPLLAIHRSSLIVPTALSTALAGVLLLVTRRKAITQVLGFLSLENGIFAFGLLLLHAVPTLVEVAVLLDLFACVFVMGIIMNQVKRTFSSLDTYNLSSLREQ